MRTEYEVLWRVISGQVGSLAPRWLLSLIALIDERTTEMTLTPHGLPSQSVYLWPPTERLMTQPGCGGVAPFSVLLFPRWLKLKMTRLPAPASGGKYP